MWTKDENKWIRIIGCGKIGCCGTCDERLECPVHCSKSEDNITPPACEECYCYMQTLDKYIK